MSGHSKWHTIKHKKGALDAKRGKLFTKLIKEISISARSGGGDVNGNARLRKAVNDAKAGNMPNDTIDRAIKRGTGELEGVHYEEVTYEGYGPGGVAVMVQTTTDNRNRTVSELRHIFSKNGGNLGESGSVAWMFNKKGQIIVDAAIKGEDAMLEIALEAGAEDMRNEGESYEILTASEDFHAVLDGVKAAGIEPVSAEIAMIPINTIKLEGSLVNQMLKLYDALDDHDDVQSLASNFEIDDAAMEQTGA
ncbi:MAG: YebC/PmpR family DNA-binding transcriptional regulator [Acidobacteria bacterium]|nr:YebC/PmpR family DNA-binding transcriptional regulator [Acidobacteriota bacterium]MBK7597697.1 YebC/PmpR family DNA-binding transcriptional regulator [Acidobacteriota bacterium]MBK8316702.1 YebC/PmpR family DNA-binding transcriptional regulator [Acidobacteriota bacterium]MBK9706172.1 YebC/PmpR family DNA-binding transcriptional regulator [Acidobacteriota bacterium]